MMIELGFAIVHFRYPRLSDEELDHMASRLFDVAETSAREFIRVADVETILELEEGTLKARSRYLAPAVALGAFLNFYGSIREGIDYVARDVRAAGEFVIEQLPRKAGASDEAVISRRRHATLQRRVNGIMRDVEIGKISADHGTFRLMELLDHEFEGTLSPQLLDGWERELSVVQEVSELRKRAQPSVGLESPGVHGGELILSNEQSQHAPVPALPERGEEPPVETPDQRQYPDPFRPRKIVVVREGPANRKVVRRE